MIATTTTIPQTIEPTATGLNFTGELSFEEWSEFGRTIGRGMQTVAWYIGDWLLFGEAQFEKKVSSEAYDAAVAATGLDRTTLKTYTSVCRSIPASERVERLSFDHHKTLAPMPKEKREEWVKVVAPQPSSRPISAKRLRTSIRMAGETPRIVTDEEILNRGSSSGHDNYVPHLSRLITVLRATIGGMDADQKLALKEDSQPLLALLQAL